MRRALVVQANSGYDDDNGCLIDVLDRGSDSYRGMAVVPNNVSRGELEKLHPAGVVGVTFNAALLGANFYSGIDHLFADLADLDMFVDLQVQDDDHLLDMLDRLAIGSLGTFHSFVGTGDARDNRCSETSVGNSTPQEIR